jgi:hypothetical protein
MVWKPEKRQSHKIEALHLMLNCTSLSCAQILCLIYPRANGAERRSGRKSGTRVLIPCVFRTELYNNWRTCSYTSFSQRSEAKNMADFEWKWRHFHDNTYFIFMVGTTDQAQFWAYSRFHTPLVFAKTFCRYIVLVVLNRFLNFFRYRFSTFDHLDKDMQSYVLFSSVKDDK